MNVQENVKRLLVITFKMSTAIAYSFMTMNDRKHSDEKSIVSRRYSNHSEKYSNAGYDSEAGTLTRSGKRRPRKRSSSGSRTKGPRVSAI